MPATYLLLSYHGESTGTNAYQWGLVAPPPEHFPGKMNEMFRGFEFIQAYIDELLIITKGDWSDHLEEV